MFSIIADHFFQNTMLERSCVMAEQLAVTKPGSISTCIVFWIKTF